MKNIKDKIAIIGFGASGFGTYLGLKEKGFKNIYIYDHKPLEKKIKIDQWDEKNLEKNYKILKNKLGFGTANSKTYFGNELKSITNGFDKIYDNKISSGLLNFWGGVLQKFDPKTLNLSLNINNLDDYYSKISKNISISQVVNKNSQKNIYTNQEKIKCNKLVEEISESIIGNSLEIIEKDTILAISQNNKEKNCNCFIGCLKHKIFNTNRIDLEKNVKIINQIVKKIDFDKKKIITDSSSQTFDKIYLNAGPYYDQKILIDSSEKSNDSIKIKDSSSFTFPIFYKGKLKKNNIDFTLTNCVFCIKNKDIVLGHAQIYPPAEHLNKSIFPYFLWNKFNFIKNVSINRLLWARCYLNDEYSQIKEFSNDNNINYFKNKKIKIGQKMFFEIFKKNLDNKNFLPINFFINSKTSSHYTGESNHVRKNILKQDENHYKKNIFFNDSLLWDNLPSQSPTFTIMANALRNTDLYL
tara:strand:+ start:1329 stop:2735 length:1407 start_codon:yes stop_codon:yes gene_type:complete